MAWSKLSRQERGYGAAWDRVRKIVRARDHDICQVCEKAGRLGVVSNIVDHIMSKENAKRAGWSEARTEHPDNLQVICEPCHLIKTEAEQGKQKHVRVTIGLDGFPIEDAATECFTGVRGGRNLPEVAHTGPLGAPPFINVDKKT